MTSHSLSKRIPQNDPQAAPQGNSLATAAHWPTLVRLRQKAELFAAKGVAYHNIYARWRFRRLASRWQRQEDVQGSDLAPKLALDLSSMERVRAAYAQANTAAANVALQAHFRTRALPRFFFAPTDVQALAEVVQRVDAAGKALTVATANQLCRNIFAFRNTPPVEFAATIDWQHAPHGNTDWRWDLNRHAYFETLGRAYLYTGNEQYAAKFCELLHDWLKNNPPSVDHPNWESVFEVAFRINTWIWALHLFQHSPTLDAQSFAALLAGLWAHGHFLDTHLELHAQNNHLLLEAKSLAMLGLLFPEFKEAAQWRERGLRIFCTELAAQVCSDGVHGERASLYHRIISGEVLELVTLAANNNVPLPPEIPQILGKMVEFERAITKPDGKVSLVGDSALEDVHLRFSGANGGAVFLQAMHLTAHAPALSERDVWLLGNDRVQQALAAPRQPVAMASRAFAEGGYFTLRSGEGENAFYALFDCGPFGYERDATHGHADALNIELYAHGQTWIVDPGVYSTHLGWAWRRFFRGTHSHNTVVVDDQDQSRLLDGRRVYHPAKAMHKLWRSNATFDFVAGSHDGYERLAAPITHHRQLLFVKGGYWVVVDDLVGSGEHTFDLYFHLMPGLQVELHPTARAVHATNEQGASLRIVPVEDSLSSVALFEGATNPIQGWVGLYSGEKCPAPALRYRRIMSAPARFCTVLYPQAANALSQHIHVEQLDVTTTPAGTNAPDARPFLALRIDTGECVDDVLLAPGSAGIRKRFGDYEGEGEVVVMRRHKVSGETFVQEG